MIFFEFYINNISINLNKLEEKRKIAINCQNFLIELKLHDYYFDSVPGESKSLSKSDVLWLYTTLSVNCTFPVTFLIQGASIFLGIQVWAVSL